MQKEINFNDVDFVDKELKDYTKELLNADIRVFIYEDNKRITYLKIAKGDNVGYVERNDFIGFNFSTVHKPNRQSGTGYSVGREIINPKIENALNTFVLCPYWGDPQTVNKYKDVEECLKQSHLKYLEVIL